MINTSKNRKPISKKVRFEVFKRDKFTCQYCGKSAPDVVLEIDHIKPVADGGGDDMMNLVTSCFECNRGKGKRNLDDDTAVKKQMSQLQELADRREQLDMMIQWREELKNIQDDSVEMVANEFAEATGFSVNDKGKRSIKAWIKKYSLPEVLEALDIAIEQYFLVSDGEHEDALYAFGKISGICHNRKYNPNTKQTYYANYLIKAIKENGWTCNCRYVWAMVSKYVETEEDFKRARLCVVNAYNWTKFKQNFEEEFERKE